MALITRISRLFKADFHAVLDHVEEPEMLLRLALKEMEDALAEAQQRQRQSQSEKDTLHTRRVELDQTLSEIREQLDVCFESDEEDLARDLIKRKLQSELLLKRLSSRLGVTEKELAAQQKAIEENQATLESMRQKAELFAERTPTSDRYQSLVSDISWSPHELNISDNDVEVALLRERKLRRES